MDICLEFYWDEEEKKAKIKTEGMASLAAAYSSHPISVVDFLEDCNKMISEECQDVLKAFYSKVEASA